MKEIEIKVDGEDEEENNKIIPAPERKVNVIEYEGTITTISELREAKNKKKFYTIRVVTDKFPMNGYCWEDTTGLFAYVKQLDIGDNVKVFAEESKGFINIKSIFKLE